MSRLSASERAIWLAQQLDPGHAAYNMALAVTWRGPLDVPALMQAFQTVVAESDALRTVYLPDGVDGCEVQVRAHGPVLHQVEAAELDDVDAWMQRQASTVFDLSRQVCTAHLIRHAEDHHTLLTVQHHLVTDGGSFSAFLTRLVECYTGTDGAALPSYRAWAEQPVDARVPATRATLEAAVAGCERPTHWNGRIHVGGPCRRHVVELPARLDDAVATGPYRSWSADLARQALLATASAVTVSRLTGVRTVVLGTPHPMRWTPDAKRMIGVAMENLPLALRLEGASHVDLFQQARNGSMELLRGGRPGVSTSTMQRAIAVDLNYIPQPLPGLPGCEQTVRWLHAGWSEPRRVPVRIQVHDFDGTGRRALVDLATDAFPDPQAFVDTFLAALDDVLDAPDQPALPRVDWALARRRSGLLQLTPAPPLVLHEAVFTVADRTPERIAIRHDGHDVTYAQLRDRARAITAELQRAGIGPGDRVALCHPRTPGLIAGLLGILACGAAYVPVEPSYPQERLQTVVADCAIAAVVTVPEVPFPAGPARIQTTTAAGIPAPVPVSADDRAYLLYTSGSTGRPKAVEVLHRNVAALLSWSADHFGGRLDHVLGATSVCFDVSVFELFGPLTTGGCLHLADDLLAAARSPDVASIRLLCAVPSAVRALLAVGPLPFVGAETVVLAGEYADTPLVDALYATGVRDVYDLYGPTEATVYVLGGRREVGAPATIGRPLPGDLVYLLDEALQPVADGATGEIHLGGNGLARGYWGRDALTAERFVAAPVESGTDRLYKTGDLGRFLPDGQVVYAGRIDEQLKVRGFRIEPGEIVAVARGLDAVEDLWVGGIDGPLGTSLAAAVVGCTPEVLRDHLTRRLPAHMVPTVFTALEALPRTPSDKVDSALLRSGSLFGGTRAHHDDTIVAELCGIVEKVGGRAVAPDQRFVDTGGDSILALHVSALAHKRGLSLRPMQLLGDATLAELASEVARQRVADPTAPVGPVHVPPAWVLAHGSPHFAQALAIQLGDVGPEAVQEALDALIAHHDLLRLRVLPQPHLDRHPMTWPLERVAVLDDPLSALTTRAEAFDFAAPPLVGAILDERGILGLVAHHYLVDAISWTVLLDDLAGLLAGDRLPLRTSGFPLWSRTLAELPCATDFWTDTLEGSWVALPDHGTRVADLQTRTRSLSLPRRFTGPVRDLLLASLGQALGRVLRGPSLVWTEGHGRIDAGPDVARTVGWFASLHPVPLTPRQTVDDLTHWFASLPLEGAGYGLAVDRGHLPHLPRRVLLQFFGNRTGDADPPLGLTRIRPDDHPAPTLEVVVFQSAARLEITWHHDRRLASIDRLITLFERTFERLAAPADFGLSSDTLGKLAALLPPS